MFEPFRNEPYSDFSLSENAAAYREALASVRSRLGEHHPLVIGGATVDTAGRIESVNPCRPDEIVGTTAAATPDDAVAALEAAWIAFEPWAGLSAEARGRAVARLAAVLRRRKLEISAWETFEAAKNWTEAEADVAEAIDFCEYYARQAIAMAEPLAVVPHPGEDNRSHLVPIGAGVVIPPWNFPLAILAGMAVGPVAAGNTVVIKPASVTPVIGSVFMEAVDEAGIPPGVINFVPGPGGEIGDTLVDHPQTRFVNFTGSREVGVRIAGRAAAVHPGQRWLKRAFMEMGGKDAQIVDETADLASSECRRRGGCVRLPGTEVLGLLPAHPGRRHPRRGPGEGGRVDRDLAVGPAEENVAVNAVISAAQHRSILDEIEKGQGEADLVHGGAPIERDGGYYIQPTIFAGVDDDARLAQHEIFGPVLSVITGSRLRPSPGHRKRHRVRADRRPLLPGSGEAGAGAPRASG